MGAERKKRLLIVGPRGVSRHEGGVEKFAEEFVRRAKDWASISVVVLHVQGDEPQSLRLVRVPPSRLLGTDKAWYLLYALWEILKGRYDSVFILGINFAMLAPIARLMGARVVVRSGSVDHQLTKWNSLMAWVFRTSEGLSRYAHEVVAVAPSIANHLASIGVSAKIVRNGLEFRSQVPASRQGIMALGRLTAQKNYSVLIAAAAELGKDCPPIIIVGGADASPEALKLQDQVRQLGLNDRITFTGALPRDQVLHLLQKAKLFVNCSHHEGMSNAVLEAIQEGAPLILSDIPANRDLALDDRFYFAPDDAAGLAKLISNALENPEQHVVRKEQFEDWDEVIARFASLLQLPQPSEKRQASLIRTA